MDMLGSALFCSLSAASTWKLPLQHASQINECKHPQTVHVSVKILSGSTPLLALSAAST